MALHKKVVGGGAEYMAFAVRKVQQMSARVGPTGYASNTYLIGGTQVRIRVAADQLFVTIMGDGAMYEFWTPDHIKNSTYDSPGYPGFVQGSMVRARLDDLSNPAAPLYSNSLTPPNAEWRVQPVETGTINKTYGASITYHGQPVTLKTYPISYAAWQDQKFFEHINWPRNSGDSFVSSVQCLEPGRNSEANYLSDYFINGGGSSGVQFIRSGAEVGYDVHATLYDSANCYSGTPNLTAQGAYVWWRRAAVHVAQDGTRFFVSTDNVGHFYIYKVADYVAETGTDLVPPAKYVRYTPPYPAWVTLPDPNARRSVQTSWLWAFNKDASKCVSCPFHSEDGVNYKFFNGANYSGYFGQAYYDARTSAEKLDYDKTRNDTPGLVEFGISITNNGGEATNFSATFTLGRVAYSGDPGGRYIYDAAYTLPDRSSTGTAMGVAEDTLVTAEITAQSTTAGWAEDSAATGRTRIRANDALMAFTDLAVFPATDMQRTRLDNKQDYASRQLYIFALELRTLSWVHRSYDGVSGALTDTMVVYNQSKSVTSLTLSAYGGAYPSPTYSVASSNPLNFTFMGITLATVVGTGFNIHPKGHWSFSRHKFPIETGLPRDIVHKYKGRETTHRALFNSAFKQARSADYYDVSWDGVAWAPAAGTDLYSDLDLGSFRTNGVWITFKKPGL